MKFISPTILTFALFAALALPYTTHAEGEAKKENYWNQFRGPNGDGKTLATGLPTEFSETKNVRWKTAIHDKGWSSPVVWDNWIWLTTALEDGTELFAVCVDLESGEIIHDIKVFDVENPQRQWPDLNTHATPTPIIEEGRIYVHFGAYGTACVDMKNGKRIWQRRDLNCNHYVRPASSPVIDGNALLLTFDGVDVQYTVALDKRTGETIWRKDREHGRNFEKVLAESGFTMEDMKDKPDDNNRKSFGTPTIIEFEGQKQLISPGAEVLYSYDLETGDELWHVMNDGQSWNVACRPVLANGLIYYTTGQAQRLQAVRPGGHGDVTGTHVAWSTKRSVPNMPSPLVVDDMLFMVSDDGGIVSCLDAKTGEQIWRERLGSGRRHWASPVYAAGRIYFCSADGYVTVIAAEREFKRLASNEFDEGFIASPAIADNTIILRSLTHLYCFAEGYEMAPQPEIASKPKRGKSKKSKPNSMSGLPLNITGYYMGKTRDDGEFEAMFLIEVPDLDKDDWPTVTFTGEEFRASFANLTQYYRVTLNLVEGAKEGKDRGK